MWKINRLSHKRFVLICDGGSVTRGIGRSRQRAWPFFESTHLTTMTQVIVSHSHGGKKRGRKVAQSGWRGERQTCPWVVRIAHANVLMRGPEASESSGRAVDARCEGGGALEPGRRSVSPHGGREGSRRFFGSNRHCSSREDVTARHRFGARKERPPE